MEKLTRFPLTLPSPRWGEGCGEGKFQICLARICLLFGYCDLVLLIAYFWIQTSVTSCAVIG